MSDSKRPTTSIIKSDRTGRTRYTRQYKQEVLAAYKASSLSAPPCAVQCGSARHSCSPKSPHLFAMLTFNGSPKVYVALVACEMEHSAHSMKCDKILIIFYQEMAYVFIC